MSHSADLTGRRSSSRDAELSGPALPGQPSRVDPFDPQSVVELVELPDAVVRNAWIAQRWHELSARLQPHFGLDHVWCTFAVWRSRALGEVLSSQPGRDDLRGMADHEAAVFASLAPRFERLARRLDAGEPSPMDRERFLELIGATDEGPVVRVAFSQYLAALTDRDEVRRAQRVLAANLLLALYEQQTLQADLLPPPVGGRLRRLMLGRRPMNPRERATRRRALIADVVLHVPLPTGALDLCRPVTAEPPLPLQVPSISVLVETLDMWTEHGDARAGEWLEVEARMRALEPLYRVYQRDHGLAAAPFNRRQIEALRRQQRPEPTTR